MRRHGGSCGPLTSAAVPVTLPSRVMVCQRLWLVQHVAVEESQRHPGREALRRIRSPYGVKWLAPTRSR